MIFGVVLCGDRSWTSMIIVGPFQLKMIYDSVIIVWSLSLQYCSRSQAGHRHNHRSLRTRVVLDCGRLQQYGTLFDISEQADILHFIPVLSRKCLSHLTASSQHTLLLWTNEQKENLKEGFEIRFFLTIWAVHKMLHWKWNGAELH